MSTEQELTMKGQWAHQLVRKHLLNKVVHPAAPRLRGPSRGFPLPADGLIGTGSPWSWDDLPPDPLYQKPTEQGQRSLQLKAAPVAPPSFPSRKVCIIGAGVAGLYIAMILDNLKIPNLSYEILEGSNRVGGRIYTHYFDRSKPHDYYDVGAMRFPHIPIMNRTFDLFERTKVELTEYILNGENCPKMYNDRLFNPALEDEDKDPYHVTIQNGGHVPDGDADAEFVTDAFKPFKDALKANFKKGWAKLMSVDSYSTREYLKNMDPETHDFFSVQWGETLNTSTGLFDQAFSESIMDSFDFDYEKGVKWSCVDGGATLVTDAMRNMISQEVQLKKRVEAITIDRKSDKDGNMSVKCADEKEPRSGYDTVFNTTALGCLGRMDLRSLDLDPSVKDAIRSLHYDDSVKVALKFKYAWWRVDCNINKAGTAVTDLPLRTCVYPSYSLGDDPQKETVLLASYTWAQDATRMGSLLNTPEGKEQVIDVILKDLALLHKEMTYETIKAAYTGVYHAWSWSQDPNTSGAFALFGPGQFSNLYPLLTLPAANGKFHMVGEASSVHHAWVVGALDSAVAAVHKFLHKYEMVGALKQLHDEWKNPEEIEPGYRGTVHLQLMFDETQRALRKNAAGTPEDDDLY